MEATTYFTKGSNTTFENPSRNFSKMGQATNESKSNTFYRENAT